MVADGSHIFLQPAFIQATIDHQNALALAGNHNFQQPDIIEANSKRVTE